MQPDQESNSANTFNVPDGLCRRFSLDEIVAATDNFNDSFAIGQGGFAKVYIGQINNGALTVAIKKSKSMSPELRKQFRDEILMVTRFRHTHLVSLIGYCETDNEMILVYEYMAGGTLEANLQKFSLNENDSNIVPLCWVERLKMGIGAARGLDYLHTGTGTYEKVIHRDVKSSNILLDEARITAKIADFGLSKIGPANQADTRVMTRVVGTFGYLDPDYYGTGMLTSKSDVYAFGVVLFELLCGRPAVDGTLDEDQRGLAGWARLCVKKRKVRQIIDPILKSEILPSSLSVYVKIADKCLQSPPKYRPTMTEVLAQLVLALSLQENGKRNINKSATGSMTEKFMLLFSPTPRPPILVNSAVFDAAMAAPNDMEGALNDTQAVPNDTEDTPNKTQTGPSDFESVNNALVDVPYIQPRELKKLTNNFSANDIIYNSAVFDATTAAPNDMEGALNDTQAVPNDTEDTPNKTQAGPSDFQSVNNVLVDVPYIQPRELKKITNNFSANDIIDNSAVFDATTAAPNDMEGALNDTQAVPNDTEDTPNKTQAGPSDFQSVNNVLVDVPYIQPHNSAVFDATTAAPNEMEGALNDTQAGPNDTDDTPNKTKAGPSDFQSVNNVLVGVPYIQPVEFKKITNFSANDIIGEGTYVKAYGMLKGGEASCIKKYNFPIPPIDNFLTLVTGLSRLKHENVVKALGYCADENFCILAYEYAPMGSLHDILHRQKGAYPVPVLSWLERVKIACGAAKGLEYLHEKAQPNVVHRAIKSSNVLLFNDGVVKIADIKLFDHELDMEWHADNRHPYIMPLTSVAPEYKKTGQFNSKCDVYSFGVVLLELLTGCKYRDTTLPRGQQNLVTWIHTLSKASPRLSEDEVKQCIDPRLKGKYPPEAAAKMAEIAAMCVKYKARSRPKMSIVVKDLETLVKAIPGPSSEPAQHL